jgi:ferredoxin
MLVIDPDECIDCALCEPECPVNAIFAEDDVPPDQQQFTEINARLSKNWPVISHQIDPPADAKDWDSVMPKIQYLDEG